MRKTFLAICTTVIALLAVSSCGEIWDEFDSVREELNALSERITELENKLNGDVATINSTIGALDAAYKAADKANADADAADKAAAEKLVADALAKVAVVDVKKNDAGNYVLTFANGETLEVAAADANSNNTGLVTTVTEGDVTYWAVVDKDGKVVKLDAVVHPDTKLSFKVDPETNVLLVSYDGKTYESTGVVVNDETTFNVVENFVDAEDHVVLTVGGVEYKLPKVSQNYFEIVSGKQYFNEDEIKTITVNMDGVISYMVAGAPEGWTAELTDEGLKVHAPNGYDYYEESGKIIIWVVTEDGQTKVGNINVAIGKTPATFSFSSDYADVTVDFGSNDMVYFGVVKTSDYDAESIVEKVLASEDELAEGVFANGYDAVAGNYNLSGEYKFTELLGSAPVAGETYRFWSVIPSYEYDYSSMIPVANMVVSTDDVVFSDVKVYITTFAEPTVTFKDATIEVKVEGAEKFYLGFIDMSYSNMFASMIDPTNISGSLIGIEEQLSYLNMTFWELLMEGFESGMPGGNAYLAYGDVYEGSFKGNLSDFLTCVPGTSYIGIVLPIEAGKSGADYSAADFVVLDDMIELPTLTSGGTSTVTFAENASNIKSDSFELSATTTGVRVYYTVCESGYMGDTSSDDFMSDLIESGDYAYYFLSTDDASFTIDAKTTIETVFQTSLMPETEYEVIAFAVSADGKYSNAVSKTVKTAEFAYNTNIAVTNISVTAENEVATAVFNINGDAKKLYYYMTTVAHYSGDGNSYPDPETEQEDYAAYLQKLVFNTFDPNATSELPIPVELTNNNFQNGVATLKLDVGNGKERVIFGFVQAADGTYSAPIMSNKFKDATQE